MKNKILLLVFTLITFNSFSQNLSLSEFLEAKEMSISQMKEYLTDKNWTYLETEVPESGVSVVKFEYDDDVFIKLTQISWVYKKYNTLLFHTESKKKYKKYIKSIKKIGGVLTESEIEEYVKVKYYESEDLRFKVAHSSRVDLYVFTITSKE